MAACGSDNVQMNNTYKKIAQTLLDLFAEFNSQNQSLITTLNDYSTDINANKEKLVDILDQYIIQRSQCCFRIVYRINEIIILFQQIACVIPIDLTTTIEPTTTVEEVTTTLNPDICVPQTIDSKGSYYPYTEDIFLGTGTGLVAVSYDVSDIPDRIVVIFDGNTVIDTGYVGNALFQNYLDAAVYLQGDVAGDITEASTGTFYFLKDTATDHVTVNIYSPLGHSRTIIDITCPDDTWECLDIVLDIVEIETITTTTAEPTTTGIDCDLEGNIECDITTTTAEATTTIEMTTTLI